VFELVQCVAFLCMPRLDDLRGAHCCPRLRSTLS
jgi:hypothetical protein